MNCSVNLPGSAVDDIEQLYRYLRCRWVDDAVNHAYLELMGKLALLETQPRMGEDCPRARPRGHANYRLIVHNKNTKILYRLDEADEAIYVHMVFSSQQDFRTLLYNRIIRFE